jgi:selenocysteine lyase/cysteine desulfurase
VSPHFYTTDDELRAFVDALDDVRRHPPTEPAKASY